MFSSPKVLLCTALLLAVFQAQAQKFEGIGRTATPAELKAWDIDVRPDRRGLPPGRGTVAQGQDLWEAKCAGCHGVFGESNEVFNPLVGGTTKEDIKTGRVAALRNNSYPGRTTLMKVSEITSLWDYINRAMPWTAPKTLTPDEVYAVTAYLLSLADVLPADGELSDQNMAQVQQRLPNRNGKINTLTMWPDGQRRRPDVQGSACMKDCVTEPRISSYLPEFARDAHGNLAQQQRLVGPQRGQDTQRRAAAPVALVTAPAAARPVTALLQQHACLACHQVDGKLVGPALREVAARYRDRADRRDYLSDKLRQGSVGVWGAVPMPSQAHLPEAELKAIVDWLAEGARP